jgi:hypothetical protein
MGRARRPAVWRDSLVSLTSSHDSKELREVSLTTVRSEARRTAR